MSETIPESEVRSAMAELDKVRGDLMQRPGVTAVDVGLRHRGGELIQELAIRVHVRRKLSAEELDEDQLLPEKLGRFPVDVIEAAYEPQEPLPESGEALPPEAEEVRPSAPGIPESND